MLLEPTPARGKLFAALLFLAAVVAYLPAISAGFIWDDDILLTANPQLHDAQGLKEIWQGKKSHDYTPLTLTSFWLEKRIWADNPTGYHVVNILLHALAAVLLWRILANLRFPGAWLAALFFAIHPVNVASVAWIAERKNTLSAVFFFASILCFLIFCERGGGKPYALSIGLFALAGLSKGAVATLPVVLCGCLLWRNKKILPRDLLRVLPFVLIAAAVSWLTIRYQARAPDYALVPGDFPFRVARAGAAVWHYLAGIFLPIGLSPMAAPFQANVRSAAAYLPAALLLVPPGIFFWKRKSWGRLPLFASGYYLWMLLPVLGFIWMALQQETPAADWWQYLAAPGIFAGVAGGFTAAGDRATRPMRLGLVLALSLIVGLLFLQTWRCGAIYQSMETYCSAVLAENPRAWSLQNNFGVVLRDRGELEEAIVRYRLALRDNPRFVEAHNNLGNALSATGQAEEAKAEFLAALQLSPANPEVLGNLAESYFRHGEIRQALATDAEAIKADPYNPRRYTQFGLKLAANEQFAQAAICFRNALVLDPGNVPLQVHLSRALLAAGNFQEASLVCEDAWQGAERSGNKMLIETVSALREQCRSAKSGPLNP